MVTSLASHDQNNAFEIPLSADFNGGRQGMQVIYQDDSFSSTAEQDGYTFMQEISFGDLSANDYSVGLFTQVPRTMDYIGWVCTFKPASSEENCLSFNVYDPTKS